MTNPFVHFWVFFLALWAHVITLVSGCVVTFMIGLLEKHVLKRPISVKFEIAVLLSFLFFACFQAWRDQYDKAVNGPPAANIQFSPIINVPPTQVIINPNPSQPSSSSSSDLTGFLEQAATQIVTPVITKGSPISVNMGFTVKGTQPIHGLYSGQQAILVNYAKPKLSRI